MARYYPFAPLDALIADDTTLAAARRLGVSPRTVHRWREDGRLSEQQADRAAVALNLHPFELWPEMAEHAIADMSRVCANDRCRCVFIPHRRDQRYCERACMMRAKARRREARLYQDPEFRAAKVEKNRAYRDYVKARRAA